VTGPAALLDSNVLVAAVLERHEHHPPSDALLGRASGLRFAVAAHSFAEAYSQLTRARPAGPLLTPAEGTAAIDWLLAATGLVGLSPAQSIAAIRGFAAAGGAGPLLYDHLIGQVAVLHGIPEIITWNTRHMSGLFPGLRVRTPAAFLAEEAPGR
jgi:predicted nucleic acid-binding protein